MSVPRDKVAWCGESTCWLGGYAFFLALAIYAGLNTGASMMQARVMGSLRASENGSALAIMNIGEQMKKFSLMAPLGHMLEICAWLGIADGGDDN